MILPGILASGISGHLFSSNYVSLQTVTVGSGGASSVIFSSIPQTYTHLQIRALTLGTVAGNAGKIHFNSDTTDSHYWNHYVYGSGSSASSAAYNQPYLPEFMGSGATTSPGASIIDILDYTNTNKNKTIREIGGYDANGSGYITLSSVLWLNTSAITTIEIDLSSFQQYSQFALYGVK